MSMDYGTDLAWSKCFLGKVSVLGFLIDRIQLIEVLFEMFIIQVKIVE